MKYTTTLTLFLTVFFFSCTNNEKNIVSFKEVDGQKILVCDVDKITETRNINLSELVEFSELIRLSNDTNALVGNTWLEQISSGHIFLADMQNQLFLFEKTGEFIHSWKSGRGPNEFILPQFPQFYNGKIYVRDNARSKLLEYNLNSNITTVVDIIKNSGKSLVLNDQKILSVGNSSSEDDPFKVCKQDFEGNILNSVVAKNYVQLNPPLVQESVVIYQFNKGWNIHFPTNDTLMFYNIKENTLLPKAVFQSNSHIETNKKLYEERATKGLEINNKELTHSITVVPEFETKKYYFLSVYQFGENEVLPWYFAPKKICLVDKKTHEAFYIQLMNDFWGNIPFKPRGNSLLWAKQFIQVFPAIKIKNDFTELLNKNNGLLTESAHGEIEKLVSETDENDNNIVFSYEMKE